jgi:hypothetical protein
MGNPKCLSCGLTNFATAQTCRRCGQPIVLPDPQAAYYPPPNVTYQPPAPPQALPSVWQGHPSQGQSPENYYPGQNQQPPPPESYYPTQPQLWQAPPPPQWQPPQAQGQVYNQQWNAPPLPQQHWQNPPPPMAPVYAGYGQPPTYTMPQSQWVGPKPELTGLGGWLVLPAIGIVIRPIIALFGVFGCLAFFGAAETLIATIGLRSYQQLKPIVGFELLANMFMMGFCIYVAIQFFRKKSNAPKLYMISLFAQVIIVTIDALLMNFLYAPVAGETGVNSEAPTLGIAFVSAAIWTSYFTKSVRVKNTFVN